jgi:predicted MFS family arabinose efflux permease
MNGLRERMSTPAGRGLLLITITTAAVGFAMAAQGNIVANYFENVLNLSGPEFGYITAIREIPGFLLIFLTALFYRLSLPRLTAGALVLLTIGYGLFGLSSSLWSVAPWVIISSIGYHTWLQTQYALGMSLTSEKKAGSILGHISAVASGGGLVAMIVILITFHFGWMNYWSTFVLCGLLAFVGACAILTFPILRDGLPDTQPRQREPIVLRREYGYYYLLSLLDGGRQQIFFSFGLWVLVNRYQLDVPAISMVLIVVSVLNTVFGRAIGRMFDRYGEKPMLTAVNIGYVIALCGYGLIDNLYVALACYIIYSIIFPISGIGAATYLRKVAVADELAPSLAMGVTLQHAAAVVVPMVTGYILNFIGYQLPFLVAAGFACLTFVATQRLDPGQQKSPRRIAEEAVAAD